MEFTVHFNTYKAYSLEAEIGQSMFRFEALGTQSDGGNIRRGRFIFPDDALILFDLYDRLHSVTQGAVDPPVGKDLELLGYDSNYSLAPAADSVRAWRSSSISPVYGCLLTAGLKCLGTSAGHFLYERN